MVWIIALLCMGMVGLAGYYRGPICAGFSFLGILFGSALAGPLSPLTQHLLPLLGWDHPLWRPLASRAIAFVLVLIIFKIVGHALHQKMTLHFKYQKDERLFFRWERLYPRLGFCVGVLNGAVYFFLLMLPVYIAGYFTTELAGDDAPGGVRLLTRLRAELHGSNLDRVVAAHDPLSPEIYQASDIIDLVMRNPLLESRLAHYPPLLTLDERPEIKAIAADVTLQQMIQTQAKLSDILAYPRVQAIVTNAAFIEEVRGLMRDDMNDLQEYLNTGKSPKFDAEKILGLWTIDLRATQMEERRRNPEMTPRQIAAMRANLVPLVTGLSLTATIDDQMILKKQNPNSTDSTVVGQGTWKNSGDAYEVTLPGNKPDTVEVKPDADGTMNFPRDGHVLIFNKET